MRYDLRETRPAKEMKMHHGERGLDAFMKLLQYFMPENISDCAIRFVWPSWKFVRNRHWLYSVTGENDERIILSLWNVCEKHKVLQDDGDGLGRLNAFDWLKSHGVKTDFF